jgi:class 3 adenylate cyclase
MNQYLVELEGKDILIVDDTPDNLRILSSMLLERGCKVRKALSGEMALVVCEKIVPDLILLDVMMPEMDGYDTCKILKTNEKTSQIPVIFVSALNEAMDKVKAFEVGGADYITKPFQKAEVLARVHHQLTISYQKKQLEEKNQKLQAEIKERQKIESALRIARQKSERLLLNIFPSAIVDRLKEVESPIADQFEEVTILFADIVGFTAFASRVSPLELVNLLGGVFSAFDRLTEKYNLEKIKTIGDGYMVVGGLPIFQANHAEAIANMALDMLPAITTFKTDTGEELKLRIGINSGPAIAGVIGSKKFSYDLWGDTVNLASRMEELGKTGKIQVSESTYELLKDKFLFEKRGEIEVKGKGKIITYWLVGKK